MRSISTEERAAAALDDLSSENVHIALLQETWLASDPQNDLFPLIDDDWKSLFSTQPEGEQRRGRGLAILVSGRLCLRLRTDLRFIREERRPHFDFLAAEVGKILLVNIYVHCGHRFDFDEMTQEIGDLLALFPNHSHLVAGDFNSPLCNRDLAASLLSLCSLYPLLDETLHATRGRNLLDNMYFDSRTPLRLVDLKTGAHTTDHSMILANLLLQRQYVDEREDRHGRKRTIRWKLFDHVIDDPVLSGPLLQDINQVTNRAQSLLDLQHDLVAVSGRHLGTGFPVNRRRNPAMTANVQEALRERRAARRRGDGAAARAANKRFRRLYRKSARRVCLDRNRKLERGQLSLHNVILRYAGKQRSLDALNPRCAPQQHVLFWMTQYTSESSRIALLMTLSEAVPVPSDLIITDDDVLSALSSMRITSPGPDGLSLRLVKHFPEILVPTLAKLFQATLMDFHPNLKHGRTVLLPKSMPPSDDPSKYRPITILPCLTRLLLKIIESKMRTMLAGLNPSPISVEQAGFIKGRSTHEQAFLIHLMTDYHRDQREPLFAVLLDIQKAFDSIHHGELLEVLTDLGVPPAWVSLVARMLADNSTEIFGEPISLQIGTIQGGPPSPLFCIVFLEDLVRRLKARFGDERGGELPWPIAQAMSCLILLLFADDLVLFDTSIEGLQEILDCADAWAQSRKLRFNASKSSAIHLSGKVRRPLPLLRLGTESIKWATSVMYLGFPLIHHGRYRRIEHRYEYKANASVQASFLVKKFLRHSRTSGLCTSAVIREIIVTRLLSRVLYPTSVIDIKYSQIDRSINKLLRFVFRLPKDTHNVFLRLELGLWSSEFMAHVHALLFLWRVCRTFWFAAGARALLNSTRAALRLTSTNIKILARYRTILSRYQLTWQDVFSVQDLASWTRLVHSRVAVRVISWVNDEADRIFMPHLKALVSPHSIKVVGTVPLPAYLSFEVSLSRVALHFRSDRLRHLRGQSPAQTHCRWCNQEGGENGRHFARCSFLPDALFDCRLNVEIACEAEVPGNKVKETLSFDYSPHGGLSRRLVRCILVFQRHVLRSYRRQFFGRGTTVECGFPLL